MASQITCPGGGPRAGEGSHVVKRCQGMGLTHAHTLHSFLSNDTLLKDRCSISYVKLPLTVSFVFHI